VRSNPEHALLASRTSDEPPGGQRGRTRPASYRTAWPSTIVSARRLTPRGPVPGSS